MHRGLFFYAYGFAVAMSCFFSRIRYYLIMSTITIPKKEYKKLVEQNMRYEYARFIFQEDIFSPPPSRNAGEVIRAFKGVKKYSAKFLKGLEKGLRRSPHFRV